VTDDASHQDLVRQLDQGFATAIPHNRALGVRLIDFGPGEATMVLPYDERLVGNPDTGVLHGGAVSALLDACSGAAVFVKLDLPTTIATLDLRIDYLKPATPRRDVVCKAQCFKATRHVAFVRALAYHDDESDPIAAAAGSFMIFDKGRRVVQKRETEGE
jgi:uncharacterized protein (TIGR00369 family)